MFIILLYNGCLCISFSQRRFENALKIMSKKRNNLELSRNFRNPPLSNFRNLTIKQNKSKNIITEVNLNDSSQMCNLLEISTLRYQIEEQVNKSCIKIYFVILGRIWLI